MQVPYVTFCAMLIHYVRVSRLSFQVRAAARASSQATADKDLLPAMQASRRAMAEVIIQKMHMFAPKS